MKLPALFDATQAEVLWIAPDPNKIDVQHVISSDLMSDVLMMDLEHPLLLTSLVSDQSLRTAHVVEAAAVLIANDKTPPPQMVQLAAELQIPLARTALSKFDAAVVLGKALAR